MPGGLKDLMSTGHNKFFLLVFIGIAIVVVTSVYRAIKEAIHATHLGVVSTPPKQGGSSSLGGRAEALVGQAGRGMKGFFQDKLLNSHTQAQPLPGQYQPAHQGKGAGAGESYYPDARR